MADAQVIAEEAITMAEAQDIAEGTVTPLSEENFETEDSLNKMMDCVETSDNITKMDCDEIPESKDNVNKMDLKENYEGKDKKEEDPVKNAEEALLRKDSKMKLKRFCFLGSFNPVFIHLRGYIKVYKLWPTVKDLVKNVNDEEFLPLMREVLHEVPVVRRDEALFVYAAYLASSGEMNYKKAMRIAFPVLIRTDDDLFLFCKYTSLINIQEKRKCFSRTVRRAIKSWYEVQPAVAIRSMWLSHRGLHGFTHKALIKLCHVNDDSIGSTEVASIFFRTCTELIKEAESQNGIENAAEPQVDTENVLESQEEAELIVHHQTDAKSVAQPQLEAKISVEGQRKAENATETEQPSFSINETHLEKDQPAKQVQQKFVKKSIASPTPTSIVVAVSKLRTTQKKHDAIKIIRKFKLSYSQVPGYWLRFPVIMEAVLPTMSYLEILKSWRKMARYNHFEINPKILKTCKKMLENVEFAKTCSIYPVHILMSRYDIGKVKEVNAARLEYLDKLYNDSFHWAESSGKLRMHITLNLQSNYKNKLLKNHKNLTYYDACLALSLGYYNREAKVDVFYWSEEKLTVKQIPLLRKCAADKVFNPYNMVMNEKNNQRLIAPLMNAMTSEQIYDVFLCIVPTAGRGNPQQKSDLLCTFLDRYREKKNPNARFIILDLLRFNRPSMTYSSKRCENIMEICGLDDHTINLIHNFATHRFD